MVSGGLEIQRWWFAGGRGGYFRGLGRRGLYVFFCLVGWLFGALESGVWLRGGGGWTRDALVDFADEEDT